MFAFLEGFFGPSKQFFSHTTTMKHHLCVKYHSEDTRHDTGDDTYHKKNFVYKIFGV